MNVKTYVPDAHLQWINVECVYNKLEPTAEVISSC